MRLHFDQKANALYFRLTDDKIVESEEVRDGIVFDFDERGEVVAIEILNLKERVPDLNVHDIKVEVA